MNMARHITPCASSPTPPLPNPHAELLASLERLTTFNPPVQTCSTGWTFQGFYAGPTSIAFLFYRLSHFYPDLEFKSQSLLDWSHAYLQLGSHYLKSKRPPIDPSHCGIANETLCKTALQSLLHADTSLAVTLCSYSSLINSTDHEGSQEWLYGRSGYLYLLRLVLTLTANMSTLVEQRLKQTITLTISHILSIPFPWNWHHAPYLGAVHGSVGIITQILLSGNAVNTSSMASLTQQLRSILLEILSTQLASGNFPSSHLKQKQKDDRLIQFCHGSPGVILSLFSIRQFYLSDAEVISAVDKAIAAAQPDLRNRGLLNKCPCLCHGIPTTALATINDADRRQCLAYMTSDRLEGSPGDDLGWMTDAGHSDEFAGLFTGEAGRAWTWAVIANLRTPQDGAVGEKMEYCKIIGYNDV